MFKKLAVSILISSALCTAAFAKDYTLEEYQQIFTSGTPTKQQHAIETLYMSGIDSPVIFDEVEKQLTKTLSGPQDRQTIDHASWLAKALGYSGQTKYQATLQGIIDGDYHRKLKKYAKEGLTNLDQFASWNKVLSDKSQYDDQYNDTINRLARMLGSNDLELMRMAAKEIASSHLDNELLMGKLTQHLQSLDQLKREKLSIDTYAWMARAMAMTGNEQYKPLLEDLSKNAPEKKLRKYVTKYLKSYY